MRQQERTRRRDAPPASEERLHAQLLAMLSVSSGMVGVCLTAIGLVGIIKSLNRVELLVDDLLALSALLFLAAAVLSFVGMRTGLGRSGRGFVRALDVVFCLALTLVTAATLLLTWWVF